MNPDVLQDIDEINIVCHEWSCNKPPSVWTDFINFYTINICIINIPGIINFVWFFFFPHNILVSNLSLTACYHTKL